MMEQALAVQTSYEKRKKIVTISIIAMAVIVLLTVGLGLAYAEEAGDSSDEELTGIAGAYVSFYDAVADRVCNGLFERVDNIFGSGEMAEILDSVVEENSDFISGVQTACTSMGLAFVVIMGFIHAFKELQRGDGSLDMWLRILIVAVIGIIVVLSYRHILNAVEAIGQWFIDLVKNRLDSSFSNSGLREWMDSFFALGSDRFNTQDEISPVTYSGYTAVSSFNFGMLLDNIFLLAKLAGKALLLLIILIVIQIPLLIGDIALYTIWLELFIRKCFFPVAIADCIGQGARSPGVLFMKKTVALYIRIAICFMISAFGTALVGAIASIAIEGVFNNIFRVVTMFCVYMTIAKLYTGTSGVANQIVGC